MAKEIVAWCDVCLNQNEDEPVRTPGREVVVQLDQLKARSLDLCEPHYKEYIEPVRGLLIDMGSTVDTQRIKKAPGSPRQASKLPESTPGPFRCQVEVDGKPCGGGPYKDIRSLRAHTNAGHDMSFVEYRAAYGDPQPEPVTEVSDDPQYTCGIDGCTTSYPPERHARPSQALAVHKAVKHGIRGKTKQAKTGA